MSKVIQYLPADIPRILINRTVVNPPATADDDDSSDDEMPEFREGYRFDAYMLGYCDDVTRALVKAMNPEEEVDVEAKLLANIDENDEDHSLEEWSSTKVPFERVLLFPGASAGYQCNEVSYHEIAHCDGCQKEIKGAIHKCIQCFDYDLCSRCYPKLRRSHFGGKHKFVRES